MVIDITYLICYNSAVPMTPENSLSRIDPTPVRATTTEQPGFDLNNDRQRLVLQRLEEGFEAAATDEGMRAWLRVVSRFHDYSLNNTLLIMVQRPESTQVMGYGDKEGKTGWKSVGRQVRQGEKGIKIFAPQHRVVRETDEDTGEEHRRQLLTGFRVVNVFDVSQTEGDLLNVQMTKTLAHEAAHYAAGHTVGMNRGLAEVVAECSAFVIMDRYGLLNGDYLFNYVAGWANGDISVLKQGMEDIKRVSSLLIDAIEHSSPEYVSEPGTGNKFRDDDFGTAFETGQ